MPEYKERVIELHDQGLNHTQIARQVCEEFNMEYTDVKRRNVSKMVTRYNKNRGLIEECKDAGIDVDNVKHFWYKSKKYSINVAGERKDDIDFDSIFKEAMSGYKNVEKKEYISETETFDRLVWTDVHVGMDAERNGLALYATPWNKEMLFERVNIMAEYVIKNKKSDVLYIDELGDFMDGWNGETTRGGHKLPQNMSNEEAFDTGLKAKLMLLELVYPHYNMVICNNICEDNHAGSYGYVVNSAFQTVVDYKYEFAYVNNMRKFINWYFVGDHCILLSHGKDSRNLKFGFKPQLDPRQIEKIDQFLKNNELYKESKYIEFSKGDSHQCLFDMCTSDDFHYFNFPAFSPSSEWVQTNFKKGRSGFVFMTVDKFSNNKIIQPYFFNDK